MKAKNILNFHKIFNWEQILPKLICGANIIQNPSNHYPIHINELKYVKKIMSEIKNVQLQIISANTLEK